MEPMNLGGLLKLNINILLPDQEMDFILYNIKIGGQLDISYPIHDIIKSSLLFPLRNATKETINNQPI